MKQKLLCWACMLLVLSGCTGAATPKEEPVIYEEPVYRFETVTTCEEICAEDGQLLLEYNYQFLTMSVENMAALSPEDQTRSAECAAVFNERMETFMEEAVAFGRSCGENAKESYRQSGFIGAFSDATTTGGYLCGRIVSVWMENYSYMGGAHGNSGTTGCLFDLSTGSFIDPMQIAENPEAFRLGAAELLLAKAEANAEKAADYWNDYKDIISRWNEGTVIFDKTGMTVVYSPYEIGPYTLGTVKLSLSYDELSPLLGQEGLEKLGVTKAE